MSDVHDLAIFGGSQDVSLNRLVEIARGDGLQVTHLVYDAADFKLTYEPCEAVLFHNGNRVRACGAAYRMDMLRFIQTGDVAMRNRAQAHYAVFDAWLCNNEGKIASFNAGCQLGAMNKAAMLTRATRAGLRIPDTTVSNDRSAMLALLSRSKCIAKPLTGGDYCRPFEEVERDTPWRDGIAPQPAIVQERLAYPEYWIYVCGDSQMTFEVNSPELDYRGTRNHTIAHLPDHGPAFPVLEGLARLARSAGISFGAADFKSSPDGGDPVFLELNAMPMFAAYDRAADGALCRLLIDTLMKPSRDGLITP